MKFGKQILGQQVSGWGAYYLDYKSLKKIINSLEKGRLGDAALFASGIRPEYSANGSHDSSAAPTTPADPVTAAAVADANAQILQNAGGGGELQVHKAAFFFKLERELEKINAFYLQKEAELKARLRTLIDKRKLVMAKRGPAKLSKDSPSFYALYEGFRYFEKDLAKLQQFIEINATGFRKILKKWDKRSKSQTKELYLARQVEVQPCFNREFISELSDIAAANLLQLENLADAGSQRGGMADAPGIDGEELNAEKRLDFTAARNQEVDVLLDLEENLTAAIKAGDVSKASDMVRAAAQSEDRTSVSRIAWRALVLAAPPAVEAAVAAGLADFSFVDDINSRTPLHESALAGKLPLVQACVQNGVDVARKDIYGRAALSYAAMNGHAEVCTYLLSLPNVDAAAADLDSFSPLVLAVMNGHADVVNILLAHGVSVEPQAGTDLIPLCLASQGGHADITALLLQKGAKIVANPEGLTPQHLAAREGHEACLGLLVQAGANPNALEKGTQWTPLFFAAENGHTACVQVLLAAGCRVDLVDEKNRDAAFYAAWKGHIQCLSLLLQAAASSARTAAAAAPVAGSGIATPSGSSALSKQPDPEATPPSKRTKSDDDLPPLDLDGEMDGIPSLSLPPPIIPFRTYGHNYLDKRALVTVSLSNSSVRLYKIQDPNRPEPASTSSLKLVMTSRPDDSTTVVPHTIILPLAEEREVFSFQVEALERLSIEWELMPTFGTKVIGKAVALPSSFEGMTDRKRFVLPLQDVYLKVVGEVTFEIDFVKPFDGVQLEIGGRVETYWKSTLPASSLGGGGSSRMTPTSGHVTASAGGQLTAGGASSLAAASVGGAGSLEASSFVTASSLASEHLRVVVQVTKDGLAVVYPEFTLPVPGLDIYVGSVTGEQFTQLAKSTERLLEVPETQRGQMGLGDWRRALDGRMTTLNAFLEILPVDVGIDLDLLYPSSADVRGNPSLPKIEVNHFVDSILHTVYQAGTRERQNSRKIFFSSRSPTVCTALNWKQPNYAVLFASYCGLARTAEGQTVLAPCDRGEPDPRRQSVSEAVRFAKSNNLLGIMVDSIILNHVPQLVTSIKAAGLLLITIGAFRPPSTNHSGANAGARREAEPLEGDAASMADGTLEDGVVHYRS